MHVHILSLYIYLFISSFIYFLFTLSRLVHTHQHELKGVVRDREDVGWSLNTLLASVGTYNLLVVHWEPLVGVHSCTEQARVGLKGRRERHRDIVCH